MKERTCIGAVVFAFCWAVSGMAQTAQTGPAASVDNQETSSALDSSPAPTAWRVGPVNISGVVDGYYSLPFNHPALNVNSLRNFDDKANQMELNMAMVALDYAPKPVGFHVDAGFGRTFDIISVSEKDVNEMRFLKQAYVSLKPARWKGVELDFGRFVTSASAEVIETSNNFNYSRSLLFVWCTPYHHFGMRASVPITKQLTGGAQLVSGWNNIMTGATFRTVGLTGSWTKPKFTWTNTYYGGPDENKSNQGMRDLYDSVLLVNPNSKTSFYFNFDYLHDSPKYAPSYKVYGIAGAAKSQLTKRLSLSQRLEWLNDNSGRATGTAQQVKEVTLTGTYSFMRRLSGWLEFRLDWSNQPFFNRGDALASWRNQPTLLVGMVAIIGPGW
jgi:hypothetical protein